MFVLWCVPNIHNRACLIVKLNTYICETELKIFKLLLEEGRKSSQNVREGERKEDREGGRGGKRKEGKKEGGKMETQKRNEKKRYGLKFSVVYEKNPLKNFKQRCDIIRFLLSERTTLARAWTA